MSVVLLRNVEEIEKSHLDQSADQDQIHRLQFQMPKNTLYFRFRR